MELKRVKNWCLGAVLLVGLLMLSACATSQGQTGTATAGDAIPQRSVTEWPTGVTVYHPDKVYNGYTLWCSLSGDGTVNLMDLRGNAVHQWNTRIQPGVYGELLPGGNLLYSGRTQRGFGSGKYHMSGKGGVLLEYTWEGDKVAKVVNHDAHHDQQKLPNGNYAQILWTKVPEGFAARIPGGIPGTEFDDGTIMEEKIVETTPEGEVVWSWRASDHLNPDDHPICPINDRLEWLHINSIFHLEPGNSVTGKEGYLLSLRHTSQIIALEKATGKMLWSYGGHMAGEYGKLGAQHDAVVIPDGHPGEGNILVFDNGMGLPSVEAAGSYWGIDHSRILEIAPENKRVVWRYAHEDEEWDFPVRRKFLFNAPYISGAQRLPNGNTLICDGPNGRLFEVTRGGEIVWEFINPDRKAIFRAYRYASGSPELQGRQLPAADPGAAPAAEAESETDDKESPEEKEEQKTKETQVDDEWEEEQPTMKSY